jgi:hypothetical protein
LLNGPWPYEQLTEKRCPQRFFSVRAQMVEDAWVAGEGKRYAGDDKAVIAAI